MDKDINKLHEQLTEGERDLVARAKRVLDQHREDKPFEEWITVVGEAWMAVRREAMRIARTNYPRDHHYRQLFDSYCRRKGLDIDDKALRSNLLWLMEPENRSLMEKVRRDMSFKDRIRINNPSSMAKRVREAKRLMEEQGDRAHAAEDVAAKAVNAPKPTLSQRLEETGAALAKAHAEIAMMKERDGSLFDLKKDSPDSIARITGETVGLAKSKSIRKALDGWIGEAEKRLKAKNAKQAG